jgi:hypothetical protein
MFDSECEQKVYVLAIKEECAKMRNNYIFKAVSVNKREIELNWSVHFQWSVSRKSGECQ